MADLTEQIIDQKYEILELLDEGGMATVYRANDIRLNRTVALKIIPKEKFNTEELEEILQRFNQEARALAKLTHPNIVPILDCGEYDGSPYLVLEYLSGGTLRKWMEPPLHWQVAVNVMIPIMDALTYCHQQSILHRDIKPSNILFREDDTPVLTDFGIAKLLGTAGAHPKTITGVFVGTPGYMAPEQHNNSNNTKLDARTDVYQLGIVLYEAITGHRPSDLANIVDPYPIHHPKEFVPNLPVDFDKILLKALAFKPKERYQTMEDFKSALQNTLNQHPYPTDTRETMTPKKVPKRSEDKDTPRPSRPLRVFLSSAQPDAEHVTGLSAALQQEKVKVRPDKKNSEPGENWRGKISKDVQRSDVVIVCLTKDSVVKNGTLQPEIKVALEKAHERSLFIIPLRLHDCKIPQELSTIKQVVDIFEEDGYLKLHSLLAARAKQINASPPSTGAFYIPPNLGAWDPEPIKYVTLAAIFVVVILGFLILLYSSFQPGMVQTTPTQETSAAGIIVATEARASAIPPDKPRVTAISGAKIDRTGTEMVLVASGEFSMGYKVEEALEECKKYNSNCSPGQFSLIEPAGKLFLKSFYIDKYEVTNSAYQKCVDAKVCQPPRKTSSNTRAEYYGTAIYASYPVVYVDWNMAKTYCEWRDARLPTEAEWEKAARGINGFLFPWGNEFGGVRANFCDKNCPVGSANINLVDGFSDTVPVKSLANGKSKYEVFNLAGNVWEWISSLYKPYPYDPNDGREDLQATGVRVVRGGSWRDEISRLFSIARSGYDPTIANDSIGFRCAKSP